MSVASGTSSLSHNVERDGSGARGVSEHKTDPEPDAIMAATLSDLEEDRDDAAYEKCRQWALNKMKNPWTGKRVTKNGPMYRSITRRCNAIAAARAGRDPLLEDDKLRQRHDPFDGLEGEERTCAQWLELPTVDPKTGRRVTKARAKALKAKCHPLRPKINEAVAQAKARRDAEDAARKARAEKLARGAFVQDRLPTFAAFNPKTVSAFNCGHRANRQVPFTLRTMDDVWRALHAGALPLEADTAPFRAAKWGHEVRQAGHDPADLVPPKAREWEELYIPSLDRRQFYCFVLSSDPDGEFARQLRIKALEMAALDPKGLRRCATKCSKPGTWEGLGMTKREYVTWLVRTYASVGGKGPSFDNDTPDDELLAAMCQILARASTPGAKKVDRLFCAAFNARVHVPITLPSLDLPFQAYRDAVTRAFRRFANSTPDMKDGCVRKRGQMLQLAQQQKFVRAYLTPANPVKGLLLNHAAGTGKTVACISVVSSFLKDDGGDPWKVIWVTRPALRSEPTKAMFEDTALASIRKAIKAGELSLAHVQNKANWPELRRRYARGFPDKNIVKYSSFANMFMGGGTQAGRDLLAPGGDPLARTLLVFDEAHNIFNETDLPPTEAQYMNKKSKGRFSGGKVIAGRDHIVAAIHNSYAVSGKDSVRVLLATATPMTAAPTDACKLLNLLIPDPAKRLPTTMAGMATWRGHALTAGGDSHAITPGWAAEFQDATKGTVSYFAGDRDPRYFAIKRAFPDLFDVQVSDVQQMYLNKCAGVTTKASVPVLRDLEDVDRDDDSDDDDVEGMDEADDDVDRRPLNILAGPGGKPLPKFDWTAWRNRRRRRVSSAADGPSRKVELSKLKGADAKRLAKARDCMRNVSNMAAVRGKLLPLTSEYVAQMEKALEKNDEAKHKAREKHFKKVDALRKKHDANLKAWAEYDLWRRYIKEWGGVPKKPVKPKAFEKPKRGGAGDWAPGGYEAAVAEWEAKTKDAKAEYAAALTTFKERKALKPNVIPSGARPGDFVAPVFRWETPAVKPIPVGKNRPSFSFTFDGTRWTPDILKRALNDYGPKLAQLLETIDELDAKTMEQEGKLYKHAIYTDTQGAGMGAKIVAAVLIAHGYARACKYKTQFVDVDGARKRVTVLEPPSAKTNNCKGQGKLVTAESMEKRHTFCLLASTSVDGQSKSDARRDATVALFNRSDNINGEQARFILLDSGFKEGISLADVKFMHLAEPPLSQSSLKQAIARAVRRCKSTHIKPYDNDPKGWVLQVLLYSSMLTPPQTEVEDRKSVHDVAMDLLGDAVKDMKLMDSFERLLVESAVDKDLNAKILTYVPDALKGNFYEGKTAVEKYKEILHL